MVLALAFDGAPVLVCFPIEGGVVADARAWGLRCAAGWSVCGRMSRKADLMADFRDSLASGEQSRLLDERRFGNGVVNLRYRVRT